MNLERYKIDESKFILSIENAINKTKTHTELLCGFLNSLTKDLEACFPENTGTIFNPLLQLFDKYDEFSKDDKSKINNASQNLRILVYGLQNSTTTIEYNSALEKNMGFFKCILDKVSVAKK